MCKPQNYEEKSRVHEAVGWADAAKGSVQSVLNDNRERARFSRDRMI